MIISGAWCVQINYLLSHASHAISKVVPDLRLMPLMGLRLHLVIRNVVVPSKVARVSIRLSRVHL